MPYPGYSSGFLLICRNALSVFYSPSQQGTAVWFQITYKNNLSKWLSSSIWINNETGTTPSGENKSLYNSNEGILHTPQTWRLVPYHQIQFNFIARLVGFYGISTFVGHLTPNPYLWKLFYLKQFSSAWVHSLIIKNVSISSYSVYSNSTNSANSI